LTNPIAYYCFSSKPVGKNKLNKPFIWLLEAKKDYINDTLISHLNSLFVEKDDLSKIATPYQYDPIYSFSTKDIYRQIAPLFYKVSDSK
jgi:hypothetical protein